MKKKLKVFIDGSSRINYSKDLFGQFENQLVNTLHVSGLIPTTIEKANLFISVNHSNRAYKKYKKSGGTKNNAVLIRVEPIAVFPAQYSNRVVNKYGLIVTLGQAEETIGTKYNVQHPYSYLANPNLQMTKGIDVTKILSSKEFEESFQLSNWNKRKITVSLIASNKVSCIKDNNYELRRKYAHSLPSDFLKVYGDLWDASFYLKLKHRLSVLFFSIKNLTFPSITSIYGGFFRRYNNFAGPIFDKHTVVKQSRFSLVIENSNYYISEKIFDALICGSIPIYFGPDLEKMGIPGKELAVLYRGPVEELESFIMNLTENDIENYLSAMKQFLRSKNFVDVWLQNIVYRKIAKKILNFYQ